MRSLKARRQRKRWKVRRAVELWVNLMVCALSHEALGTDVAPLRGRREFSLNPGQAKMCSFLRTLAVSVVRLASDTPGSGLRLPATAGRLNQLREQLGELGHVPYAGSGRRFDGVRRERAFTATQALPVVSSRLSLPEHVQNFDPTPYLSPTFRHVYESPGDFLKAEEEMPPPIRVRGTASRQELLKVFERWDKLGRLYICHEKEVSPLDRCEIFAVAKDVDRDRQILHRKRRNMRERHLVGASKDLPHGVLLCQLPLEDKYVCVCSVDDVKDFYHAYSASTERAKSSPVGPSFRASEVAHLGAFKDAIREGRLHVMSRVACCFRGLGMGDHAAVDIAQESHTNLLKAYGGLVEGEVLRYRNPLPDPPSKFYEGIMIDDHLGIQLLERRSSLRATLDQAGRDEEAFASAEQAYAEANLESHPKKRQRRVLNAKVWGIEIEGLRGLVGPVRSRLLALATLTARAAAPGPVDQQVLEGLCGLWSFSAQFRRPMFSFMYAMYHQQGPGRADEPFRLTREARHELSLLACLAPLCLTDLRAIPDDFLYCVDASPSGAGVCRTKVGRVASREFWRRGDKLGYRMPLLSKLSASLIGSGWGEEAVESMLHASEPESWDPEEDGETPHSAVTALVEGFLRRALRGGGSHFPVPTPLADAPFDFLEVYAGKGNMSRAWARRGFRVLPPLDLKQGWDLLEQDLFWGILGLVRGGKIRFLWWAPPRTTFSLARAPKLRSSTQPWGFQLLDRATQIGNLHAAQSFMLALGQVEAGQGFVGEQRAFGVMRLLEPWTFLLSRGAFEVVFDWCRFGASYTKTTRLLSNVLVLKELGLRCHHKSRHDTRNGRFTTKAGEYCPRFCNRVASLVQGVWDSSWGVRSSLSTLVVQDSKAFEELGWVGEDFDEARKTRLLKGRRKQSSSLWAVQLSESLQWHTFMQYKFKTVQHINLQEAKARRSLVQRLPRDRRVVIAQDSRVNLGALGKGRSPSESLNAIMRSEAPYVLAKNLYIAGLHLPTWSIRADAPSRGSRVLQPRIPCPSWWWALRANAHGVGDILDGLEGLPRAYNRWCFLIGAALLRASSDDQAPHGDSRSDPVGARAHHGAHASDPIGLTAAIGDVAAYQRPGGDVGGHGSAPHRCFVRVARGVYDRLVREQAQQAGCCGDLERSGPKVWLAEILACQCLESGSHMGGLGAIRTPSASSRTSATCSCNYCVGLELAQSCGPLGAWLFWFVETIRSHWAATSGRIAPLRPLRKGCAVHSGGFSEDSSPGRSQSARSSGRAGSGSLGGLAGGSDAAVEAALVRFLGGIQATL